ncbi:RING-type E3 ubiquitin transferase [Heracleum sosnowskyi]|uniref:U-box domain-containing protein n=1 Tax=Heracleum sosnowskyi TaxID=360622 RepID=A0AAD8H7M0_9APIA|nr:RING-type E3 ubiquitin transferase [Heracleum sosnowskyi]
MEEEMVIPHLFRCPISLDLFTDPVILSTGHTYDRSSIEKWLAAGNLTCPVTMQKLHDPSMVPNHTLRHLIDQWIRKAPRLSTDHYLKTLGSEFSLAGIKHSLESPEISLDAKLQILADIEALSGELPSKNYRLIRLGLFSMLLEIVFGDHHPHYQEYVNFVEQVLLCVVKLLPYSDLGSLNILNKESKIARFVVLFDQESVVIRECLCLLVEKISSSLYTRQLCIVLAQQQSILRGIVQLLHETSDASKAGTKSLSALCSLESNREHLVRAGAVHGLVNYILGTYKHEISLAPVAMKTLEVLLRLDSARTDMVHHPNGISALVKMVFRVSDHEGSKSAINSLMIICRDSIRAREEVISAGVLTQLLLLLQSQCNERTKTKARMLLKLLRTMWIEDSKQDY